MSYTSSGTNSADGWNLVSNPLPSAIAFDSISRGSDVPDQYWIFNPVTGSHQTLPPGIGAGQVNGKIQSSQAFWLKANGTNVTTTVSEADKINDLAGGVFGGDQEATRPILRLTVASALNAFSDEAVFVFDQGTPDLDAEDAPKFNFHTFGAPQVASPGHQRSACHQLPRRVHHGHQYSGNDGRGYLGHLHHQCGHRRHARPQLRQFGGPR
ncbi:MAG: hypothetical protein IPL86_13140 [Flavobacteriales bacterium]|nr:hypothetical protein [Flavobacteriales bacterium]